MSRLDYEILDTIYESASTRVCRGRHMASGKPVILKILQGDVHIIARRLVDYQREYEIVRQLDFDGAIEAYEFLPHEDSCMLVLEDFAGDSLAHHLDRGAIALKDALVLGSLVARQLDRIHACDIIHCDITPANIVWNRHTRTLKIVDFDAAIRFGPRRSEFVHPNQMRGTFAYMAPEQTGRMNRSLDYRSDFYGLGVTLYRLLVGRAPFASSSALELVHAHLARIPVAPHVHNRTIPGVVSDIVMKLLAKAPENRYQSALGIARDLEQCVAGLRADGHIEPFPLAQHDIVDTLQFSDRLYGREREIDTLLAAFDRISRGARELMSVTGPSGIGKTALVKELFRPITARRGFFLAGKYDLVQTPLPYSAIVNAFQGLLRQLLTEDEPVLAAWRERLAAALGPNGQLVVDVIPEVEKILGPQVPVADVDGADANTRFAGTVQAFMQVFCAAEHPLVLFLDDVQWADAASLALLETMMSDSDTSHFLLIVSYRDNEIDPAHATVQTLGAIERAGECCHAIPLGPLGFEHVAALCADILRTGGERAQTLARLVRDKTGGSPFFVRHFLHVLHDNGLLVLDPDAGAWTWDVERIRSAGITDNIAALLGDELQKLPDATRRALGHAAFLGNRFHLPALALVMDQDQVATFAALRPAIKAHVVAPASTEVRSDNTSLSMPLVVRELCFVHDRLQQTAYQLIPGDQRAATHLRIGRMLRDHRTQTYEHDVFAVVGHLDRARALITDPDERHGLAALHLEAGEQALAAQAATAAADYLAQAMAACDHDTWQSHRDFAYRVVLQRARAEFRRGDAATAAALLDDLLECAADRFEKATIYELAVQVAAHLGDMERGVGYATTALALFGIELDATAEAIGALVAELQQALAGKQVSELWKMPVARDPETGAILRILDAFVHIAVVTRKELMMATGLHMARLVVQRGAHGLGAFGLAMFGAFSQNALGDYRSGAEFGQVAIRMAERFRVSAQVAQISLFHGTALVGWVEHVRRCAAVFDRGIQAGLAGGVQGTVAYLLYNRSMLWFFAGKPLPAWAEDQDTSFAYIGKHGYLVTRAGAEGLVMIARTLLGRSDGPLVFALDGKPEDAVVAGWLDNHSRFGLAVFLLFKSLIQLFFDAPDAAYQSLIRAGEFLPFLIGHTITSLHPFLVGVARARSLSSLPAGDRPAALDEIAAHHLRLCTYADNCPENFRHLEALLAAEIARAEGDWATALERYDDAVDGARAQGFVQFEAMAYEALATLWTERGKPDYARPNAVRARAAFQRWGAATKVADLERRYPQFYNGRKSARRMGPSTDTATTSTTGKGESLDLASVLKASQTIGGEIVLDKLLRVLLGVVFESAGAERGALLLCRAGGLVVEAQGTANHGEVATRQATPLRDWTGGAHSIVNYAARTREPVVVGNASEDRQYAHDDYFAGKQVLSVLCLPLLVRGALVGVLYLENNLASDTFTPERVEILDLIAGQMAVSLENAQLYADLGVALDEARASARLKNEFLATMSHELKTPLNTIVNLPRLMLAEIEEVSVWACPACGALFDPSPGETLQADTRCPGCASQGLEQTRDWASDLELEEIAGHLRLIAESGQQLYEMVDGILDLSLLEAGQDTLAIEPLDIRELLDGVAALMYAPARERNIELSFDIVDGGEPHALARLHADPKKATKILVNLVDNAIKFSADGSPVAVRATMDGDAWEFSVSDQGGGIPQEEQAAIFESFHQADRGATRRHGGIGLGLTIVKKLCELHHGSLRVHSEPGVGSTFIVRLPALGPYRRGS